MNEHTLSTIDLQQNQVVLELGCGGGGLIDLIFRENQENCVIGIDWSALAIRFCNWKFREQVKSHSLSLTCENASKVSQPDRTVDCICSVNTVYFWERPETVFRECARILKPGGRLVLCNAESSELSGKDYHPSYFRKHKLKTIEQQIHDTGFSSPELHYGQDRYAKFYTLKAVFPG